MTALALTPAAAYAIASQWGSFISPGDPGACLYSFRWRDGRPQSEGHRRECLAYIDEHCLPGASRHDAAQLRRLRDYLADAPLWSGAPR